MPTQQIPTLSCFKENIPDNRICEYVNDPHELAWSGLEDIEPEPEVIVGLPAPDALTPADRYLELFEDVQRQRIFPDSKTFADCAPKDDPLDILIRYRKARRQGSHFDLTDFIKQNFFLPDNSASYANTCEEMSLCQHIDELWPVMIREPTEHHPNSSLLPLPCSYVVPGGRFDELYYWDSYFTMLGMVKSERHDLLKNMADNFAWLIEKYGHIPNGNRTYYLSRSHPPVFALMIKLFEQAGLPGSIKYLPYLICEYHYWMDGANALHPDQAYRQVVCMPDGSFLNRYWDDRDTPRDESWREDIATAKQSGRPENEVYRDLRAGAASGWDYSSRWLRDPHRLSSIRTTQYIPIDLNAFLFKLEITIAELAEKAREEWTARAWRAKAKARQKAINHYLWDGEAGQYRDYNWRKRQLASFSAAAVVPLYTGLANAEQAQQTAVHIRKLLLTSGGLLTSTIDSSEQWDKPNAWAPLQWMAVEGLKRYGEDQLATEIAVNWLKSVNRVYKQSKKLVEKYNILAEDGLGSGGEYQVQDGFGWTNGVTRCFIEEYGHFLDE